MQIPLHRTKRESWRQAVLERAEYSFTLHGVCMHFYCPKVVLADPSHEEPLGCQGRGCSGGEVGSNAGEHFPALLPTFGPCLAPPKGYQCIDQEAPLNGSYSWSCLTIAGVNLSRDSHVVCSFSCFLIKNPQGACAFEMPLLLRGVGWMGLVLHQMDW